MEPNDVVLLTVKNALEMTLKSYVRWHFKDKPLPICVIDNGSEDDSIEWMTCRSERLSRKKVSSIMMWI